MIYTLIYISHPTKEMGEEELENILKTARKNNTEKDITGILVFSDDVFLQVLEGPEENVKLIFDKIQKDPRHENVLMMADTHIKERGFSEWNMAFKRVKQTELPGFLQNVNIDKETLAQKNMDALMLLELVKDL